MLAATTLQIPLALCPTVNVAGTASSVIAWHAVLNHLPSKPTRLTSKAVRPRAPVMDKPATSSEQASSAAAVATEPDAMLAPRTAPHLNDFTYKGVRFPAEAPDVARTNTELERAIIYVSDLLEGPDALRAKAFLREHQVSHIA